MPVTGSDSSEEEKSDVEDEIDSSCRSYTDDVCGAFMALDLDRARMERTRQAPFIPPVISSDISSFQCAVRFSSSVEVRPILSSKHYTPEVRKACWYQNEEYREIRYECVKEIKKIQRGEVLKDKKYCSRGLEAHTRVAGIIKNQNRRDAFDAVLSEQQTQIRLGVIDQGEIARKYQQIASSCQMWAHNIGLRDQLEANQSFDR